MHALWTMKTGSPPKSIDEYHPDILLVLLQFDVEVRRELSRTAAAHRVMADHWSMKRSPFADSAGANTTGSVSYGDKMDTGDPLADKWEAQIARGETPDFNE
jgi:hypothetical protein